jgi:hypothetical protein
MYRGIVATLRRAGQKLTYRRVAQFIRDDLAPGRPELESIDEKTVRNYCLRDKLPHPKDLVV